MANVYGVDTEKPVSPEMVRDAIVRCFVLAHEKVLENTAKYPKSMSKEEFDSFKKMDVNILIRCMFKEAGGDYEMPTKESILGVIEKLKVYATNFRNMKIIERHALEIMQLVNLL